MKRSHFVKKYSVQFVNASGKLSAPFYFHDNKPHECSQTWQVIRSEFDQMMLDNAREHGVDVHEGVHVLEVLFDGDRAVGVRDQRTPMAHAARSAPRSSSTPAGRQHCCRTGSSCGSGIPVLNKGAIWTYWQGAYRDTGRDEGATIVIQTDNKQGWFWYIPQHDDIGQRRRRGAVRLPVQGPRRATSRRITRKSSGARPSSSASPDATRVTGYFATKDYSYRSTQVAGDGWVLVGDAFGFLDPLYSSGVLLALKSGELAADAIVDGLASGDVSAAQLGKWGQTFNKGVDRMRRLVCEYYDGFSFGKFVQHVSAPARTRSPTC